MLNNDILTATFGGMSITETATEEVKGRLRSKLCDYCKIINPNHPTCVENKNKTTTNTTITTKTTRVLLQKTAVEKFEIISFSKATNLGFSTWGEAWCWETVGEAAGASDPDDGAKSQPTESFLLHSKAATRFSTSSSLAGGGEAVGSGVAAADSCLRFL